MKSGSKKAMCKNIAQERKEGTSEKQAVAIAYSIKRDADDKRKSKKDKK